MTFLQAIFLGVLQGLTEFLPVSSSGHLVLAEHLLHIEIPHQSLQGFDILLHAATALALLICYWETWVGIATALFKKSSKHRVLLAWVIIATLPGAVVGVLHGDNIAEQFRSPTSVGICFIITAAVLLLAHHVQKIQRVEKLRMEHVVAMGFAQAFALIPGLSRSGLTISAGQLTGLKRKEALDFSFLMAMPIIMGALVFTIFDVMEGTVDLPSIEVSTVGFVASFVTSLWAIRFLRNFVVKRSLAWFAVYLIPVGFIVLFSVQHTG